MKVVYVSILNHIRKVVESADTAGRRIDHVELTKREARELYDEVYKHLFTPPAYLPNTVKTGDHIMGVRLVVEE